MPCAVSVRGTQFDLNNIGVGRIVVEQVLITIAGKATIISSGSVKVGRI